MKKQKSKTKSGLFVKIVAREMILQSAARVRQSGSMVFIELQMPSRLWEPINQYPIAEWTKFAVMANFYNYLAEWETAPKLFMEQFDAAIKRHLGHQTPDLTPAILAQQVVAARAETPETADASTPAAQEIIDVQPNA
jgi:hypothetical protein